MTRRVVQLRTLCSGVLVVLACLVLPAAVDASTGSAVPDFSGWLDGADGLAEATRLQQAEPKPIFLYFYTDWCGFCRQFERELLTDAGVHDYMTSIIAVRINPEAGPAEAAVARRYGVRGFPSLFVHSAESRTISQVDRMELVDGRPQIMPAAGFIDVVKTAGAR